MRQKINMNGEFWGINCKTCGYAHTLKRGHRKERVVAKKRDYTGIKMFGVMAIAYVTFIVLMPLVL